MSQGLKAAKELFSQGVVAREALVEVARNHIGKTKGEIEYIELADPETLEPVSKAGKGDVLLLAVKFSRARLIDNLVLE